MVERFLLEGGQLTRPGADGDVMWVAAPVSDRSSARPDPGGTHLGVVCRGPVDLVCGIGRFTLPTGLTFCAPGPLLPAEVLSRPKSGMRVPVSYWFRRDLRKLAHKLLSRRRLREAGIFDPDRVGAILRYDTGQDRARHGIWLWMLLTFELWRTTAVEGESPW